MASNVKYVDIKLGPDGAIPVRKYSGDAGHDLIISQEVDIPPRTTIDVHTDIRIKMPPCTFARIVGRSSTMRIHGLIVNEGIIDNGYTGELFISVYNTTDRVFHVKHGMRLAQVLFHRIEDIRWSEVEAIESQTEERNERGFGSTGE